MKKNRGTRMEKHLNRRVLAMILATFPAIFYITPLLAAEKISAEPAAQKHTLPAAGKQAETIQFLSPYAHKKAEIMALSDKCEMVGAKDLLHTNSYTILELKNEFEQVKNFIESVRKERKNCYETVLSKLDSLLADGEEHLKEQPVDLLFYRQHEIDESLKHLFRIRMEISDALLASSLQDMTISIQAQMDDEEASSSFYTESSRSRSLVRQEMALLLEIARRQLAFDELNIVNADLVKEVYTPHKLGEIQLNLARALAAFEEAYSQTNSAFVIARIKGRIVSAIENTNELMTFLLPYKEKSAEDIKNIKDLKSNLAILNVDMEGTLSDIQAGIGAENLEDWISSIYERLSTINAQVKGLYEEHILRKNAWISKEKEREFKDEQQAIELLKTQTAPLTPWREDFTSQTVNIPEKKAVSVQKVITIPMVEEENLLPQEKEAEAVQQKQEVQRLTPDASYTEMLRRKIEEEQKLKAKAAGN